jgi:glucose uptake protein
LIAALLCLALWTLPLKLCFKWRYELYYYDVSWGVLIGGVAAAFTLGTMNSAELTFQDSLILTGYRKMAWAFAAGGVFNLGNILLIAATVVGRMSLAFPSAFGVALVLGMAWESIYGTRGNLVLGLGGAVVVLAAIVAHAMGAMGAQDAAETLNVAMAADPKAKKPKAPATKPLLGLILGVVSGVFFAVQAPMMAEAQFGENGIAAYAAVMLFSVAFFLSSALYVPFLANFPIAGVAVPIRQYFKGAQKNHIFGVVAGLMVIGGLLAQRVAAGAIPAAQASPLVTFLLAGAVAPLAALLGIVAGDFRHSQGKGRGLAVAGVVLFIVGLALMGFGRFSA